MSNSEKMITKENIKKYLPFILLIFLSVALMIFFKHNKRNIGDTIIDGKNTLLSLIQDLQPLPYGAKLTEEDIFNFALYRTLPIDKEQNKVLVLHDEDETQSFEIKQIDLKSNSNNYKIYTDYLELTKDQREQADSILNTYRKEIYTSVFINKNNTYAVNPGIKNIRQLLLADLISFSEKVNKEKTENLFAGSIDKEKFAGLLALNSVEQPDNFIVFSADTVANTELIWDENKFNRQLAELEVKQKDLNFKNEEFNHNFDLRLKEIPIPPVPPASYNYNIDSDSNWLKVVVPAEKINISVNKSKELKKELEKLAQQFQNIKIASIPKANVKNRDKKNPTIQTHVINPYEIVNETMKMVGESFKYMPEHANEKDWEEYGRKMDSMGRAMEKAFKSKYENKSINEKLKRSSSKSITIQADSTE